MTDLALQLRDRTDGDAWTPARGRAPQRADRIRRRLLCRACGLPITAEGSRIEVAGAVRHRRTNPAGQSFEFDCFGGAPGARPSGPATAEHSWFPGYSWRFSLCGRCGVQLGWLFVGPPPPFHGLISDRLEPEPGPG
jgi:hypothetical protein